MAADALLGVPWAKEMLSLSGIEQESLWDMALLTESSQARKADMILEIGHDMPWGKDFQALHVQGEFCQSQRTPAQT